MVHKAKPASRYSWKGVQLRSPLGTVLSEKHSRTWYDKLKRTRDKVDRLLRVELVHACERSNQVSWRLSASTCLRKFVNATKKVFIRWFSTDIRTRVCVCIYIYIYYIVFRYMCCIFFRARVSYLSLSVSRRMLWKIAPTIRNMLCVVRRIRHSVKICKWQVSSREFSKKKTRSSTNLKSKVGIKTEYIDKSDTVWNCDSRNVVVQWIKFHAIVSVCSKFSRGGANNLKSKILTDVTFHLSRKIHVQVYVYIYSRTSNNLR